MRQDPLWRVPAIKDGQIRGERYPSVQKTALASCIAMTSSAYNDNSRPATAHTMGAASGDPGGGEIPVMRRPPQLSSSPKAREVVSNRANKQKNNDLMSEAMRVAPKAGALYAKLQYWAALMFVLLRYHKIKGGFIYDERNKGY